MEQHFKKHSRYIPGFHFFTSALILAALVIAIVLIVSLGATLITVFGLLVAVSLGLLFVYTRQFATGNQDRIIRAEENFRSYVLTGKPIDSRLNRNQIIALRFADDSEYAALTESAITQNLSAKDIKQAIQQWRADHHRV